jgi:hypothetical protein
MRDIADDEQRRARPPLVISAIQRCDTGIQVRWRGPEYTDCGRMIRLARCCSSACAIHPLTRLMANVGVKSSTSSSSPCSRSAV